MRFLFKLTILAIIGLALLPSFVPEEYRTEAQASESVEPPSFVEVALSAGMFVRDIGSLCDRQPRLCETGRDLVVYTGVKAREGFSIAYAMFNGGGGPQETRLTEASATPDTAVQ